jgi:hypothetical protein
MLVGQHAGLAEMGLAGRAARCEATAGAGLRSLVEHFNLHDAGSTLNIIDGQDYVHFIYAISEHGLEDTRHFQLGSIAIVYNILQELFGPDWVPEVVRFASRSPSNLRPFHKVFRAPLEFNVDESAILFASHWLERPLAPMDPASRASIADEVQRHGTTYGELLESVREDVARQLLRDTQMPIQQIADSVRFSSAANFATAFRRRSGMTPTEYRRRAP